MSDTDELTQQLVDLRDRLNRLIRTRDPVARNQLAVGLITDASGVLREVRRHAAQAAVDNGMRPAEYARTIGVSPGAVDHLLHRAGGTLARARAKEET